MNDPARTSVCATCGDPVDRVRAARVRFTETTQWFFCSAAHADEFNPTAPRDSALPGSIASVPRRPVPVAPPAPAAPSRPQPPPQALGGLLAEPLPTSLLAADSALLDSGKASLLRDPPKSSGGTRSTATPLASVMAAAPVALTTLGAGLSVLRGEEFLADLAAALILGLSTFWGVRQVGAWRAQESAQSNALLERLDVVGTRLTSTEPVQVVASDLRPGEEVLVLPGEHIPADGTISSGKGRVEMWLGAPNPLDVGDGDRVVAGAQLLSGRLQVICSKTGTERAFSALTRDDSHAMTSRVQAARLARRLTREGALASAALTGWLLWMQGLGYSSVLAGAGVVWGALSHPVARALPSICAGRWLTWASRHGICFSHERLIDRSGAVSAAILCARGTVLHGEPEVAEVHPLRGSTETEILSLAAGAESVVHHPVAAAVLRAARTRGIDLDACRSHNSLPGLGVLCVSSSGDMLVLGSRELLLREKLSMALAEDTLRALESRGLTALMLTRNRHLIGVIALQDSLRAGAKAAVQVLLDERIEPVLVSGDSRATTEAVARALAIEHVRPEIATSGRAREIKNLIEGGATVAVIGTSPRDDAALGAAPVPIVVDGASISWRDASHGKERAIGLAGRSVLAAPLALLAAKRIRNLGTRALLVAFLPPAIAAATAASQLVPLYVPALMAAAGAALAARLTLKDPKESVGS